MKQKGQQSISFEKRVFLVSSGTVVGEKEGQGPLGDLFDLVCPDPVFGEDSWEKAESTMQKEAIQTALGKAGLASYQIRYLFGGDLLGQLIATSFGVEELNLPVFGLYGACSTCGEALGLGAMAVDGGYGDYVLAVTSSHFASAEKQFRFPLAYGNQRPLSATWTVTGAGAFVLGNRKSHAAITGFTPGKIVDFGVKDSMNMGACMAPAACETIYQNFMDFSRQPKDYDRIITGDLGYVGKRILVDLLKEKGFDISGNHVDCGIEIFDAETQDTHSGGSGCGCSAVTLGAKILPALEKGAWKRVLFVPTGALLSPVSFNEGQSVPGIAHGIVIEHC
ncbi:MAG TPA: stage V sporulation protein AD [Candidatus Limivivens intestinipullorum]|uniref:Stage V sporulation protein AD n=1 Tax=Candidatus Limivivens intestinipullorum TaxID=2840858 RepID=A0A9D1JKS7_9FIRM|nr:stage V sporulation protein AD [Candidatus Limivivens intestinipullorum]